MKLLLTNDDGIDAPGLAALFEAVASLGEAKVVAPHEHASGCSHRTTTDRPLIAYTRSDGRIAVDGAPADCVRLGLLHLAPESDWVLSGVNDGGNLGVDIFMSGTVAAAREASLLGKPAIALSHYRLREAPVDWGRAASLAGDVIGDLLSRPLAPGAFWNVNFPAQIPASGAPEVVFCELDPNPLHVCYEVQDQHFHFRGKYQNRPRRSGSDVDVCFSGKITVTQVLPLP